MINRRLALAGIISAALLVIGLIIYFTFFYHFGEQAPVTGNNNSSLEIIETDKPIARKITNQNRSTTTPAATSTAGADVPVETYAVVAANFAERFGTYSNQVPLVLGDDLKLITTSKMQTWLKGYYQNKKDLPDYHQYYSLTTTALGTNNNVLDASGSKATVTLQTSRSENKAGIDKQFNQNIEIVLLKVGKAWRVDAAYWK
jgi:hypothetical protein